MKKLILFSLVTACCISFAQISGGSSGISLPDLNQAQSDYSAAPLIRFQNFNATRELRIVQGLADNTAAAAEMQNAIRQKFLQQQKVSPKGVLQSGVGWHPELAVFEAVSLIDEASYNLGAQCNRVYMAPVLQGIVDQSESNLVIKMSQLSELSQVCLSK